MSDFVFISYSKRDLDYALRVSEYLNEQHIDTWLFDVQYSNGRWWDEIVSAIYHSAAVLPILTPESQTSRWVRREIDLGFYWQKPVFSILLEGELHLPLSGVLDVVKPQSRMPSSHFMDGLKAMMSVNGVLGRNVMGAALETHLVAHDVTVDFESLKQHRLFAPNQDKAFWWVNSPASIDVFGFQWCAIPTGEATVYHHFVPHQQTVPDFEMARYPVTCAQFAHFVNSEDGYYEPRFWTELGWQWKRDYLQPFLWNDKRWNQPTHPVIGVSWHEALAFCAWLEYHYGYETGMHYRLQSEAQFVRAVQGSGSTMSYPWGEEVTCEQANVLGSGTFRTTPVDQYADYASEHGVCDLVGNMWEWCADRWDPPLDTDLSGDYLRVVRGGSWNDHPEMARCRNRFRDEPDYRGSDLGFRIVRVPRSE
jgi:formylglycine-generating enzyme required for sulfatase activity